MGQYYTIFGVGARPHFSNPTPDNLSSSSQLRLDDQRLYLHFYSDFRIPTLQP